MFGIDTAIAGAFLKKWWPAFAAAALFGTLLTLAYCKGQSAGKTGEVVKQQRAEIKTQVDLGKANDNAADARVRDAVRTTQQEKELKDATDAIKGSDRERALRGCVIMRQQGIDTSRISKCVGP